MPKAVSPVQNVVSIPLNAGDRLLLSVRGTKGRSEALNALASELRSIHSKAIILCWSKSAGEDWLNWWPDLACPFTYGEFAVSESLRQHIRESDRKVVIMDVADSICRPKGTELWLQAVEDTAGQAVRCLIGITDKPERANNSKIWRNFLDFPVDKESV